MSEPLSQTDLEFTFALRAAIRWRNRRPDCRVSAVFFASQRNVSAGTMKELVTALGRFTELEIIEMRQRGMSVRGIRNARRPVNEQDALFDTVVAEVAPDAPSPAESVPASPLSELVERFEAMTKLTEYAKVCLILETPVGVTSGHQASKPVWHERLVACEQLEQKLWTALYDRIAASLGDTDAD